jgi:hypothetical protein
MFSVEGAFLLVLIGLGASTLVFLLELAVTWSIKRNNRFKLVKCMEQFFCYA